MSNEHSEMFHQDIAATECSNQGRWDESMLTDFYRMVIRDSYALTYKRQSKKKCSQGINKKILLISDINTVFRIISYYIVFIS